YKGNFGSFAKYREIGPIRAQFPSVVHSNGSELSRVKLVTAPEVQLRERSSDSNCSAMAVV
ncbi:hypothetical protein SDJN02_26727, partial [Cucurbita argyrosperma subsp. argyrosperma]